jgi:hypothetical protein
MTNELEVRPQLSAVEVKAGLDLILQVMQKTMTKGVDFGVIPGCGDKPTLFKPGSEKILTAFRIGVEPVVEDLSTADEARFRVKTRLFHEPTGIELGCGIGECSSDEEKYKWRRPVCDKEFDAAPEDRRRLKYQRDGSTWKQIRTNKADVSNTVLKMAKKRSQIDGTLTATAASAVFNQDLEDMEKEVREAVVEGDNGTTPAPIKPPEPKKAAASPAPIPAEGGNVITFIPAATSTKPDKNGKPRWAVKSPEGVEPAGAWFSTYDEASGSVACSGKELNKAVTIAYVKKGDFYNIKGAKLAEEAKA